MARTKGAKNKRSVGIPEELRDAMGHRDPALVLAEIYSMPHEALKKQVRSAAGARAMKLAMDAAVAAMPYVHSKMPVAVTVNEDQLPTLIIEASRNQMQSNQGLIDRTAETVGRENSRIEGKSHENNT